METLPNMPLSEQIVLGTALVNKDWTETLIDNCTEKDFFVLLHRKIFKTIVKQVSESKTPSVLTMPDALSEVAQELVSKSKGIKHAETSLEVVKRFTRKRDLILASHSLRCLAEEPDVSVESLIDRSSTILEDIISDQGKNEDVCTAEDGVSTVLPLIEKRMNQLGQTGIRTGYSFLDHCTGGLEQGHLIIVAGRPAMGKTAYGQCLIQNIIEKNKDAACVLFSLEMSLDQIMERFISQVSHVPLARIRDGLIDEMDWRVIKTASERVKAWPMFISDKTMGVAKIKNEVRRAVRKFRFKNPHRRVVVLVDYLQLVPSDGKANRNRENEVGDISRALKGIAKDCDVCVVALAQLNRSCEYRENKRPLMADLRESGSIEQDADLIAFLYRDAVYNETANDDAEIILRKNRHGKIGTGFMKWKGDTVTFEDDDMLKRKQQQEDQKVASTVAKLKDTPYHNGEDIF